MELITQILLGLITVVIVVFAYMFKAMRWDDDDEQTPDVAPNVNSVPNANNVKNVNSMEGLMEMLDQAEDELQAASDALADLNDQANHIRRNRSRGRDLEDDV